MNSAPDEPQGETTDDEAVVVPTSLSEATQYEKDVTAWAKNLDPNAKVTWNVKRKGIISGRVRQIDALIEGVLGGESMEIAVECKHYTKAVGIGIVDELHGKLLDLGVEKGVLYSFGPISAGAEARASGILQAPKIRCQRFNPTSVSTLRWESVAAGLFGYGNCENPNCTTGDVSWRVWPTEEGKDPVIAGRCDICGTWNWHCPYCEETDIFDGSSMKCYSCGAEWEIEYDEFEVTGFDEVRGSTE